MNGAVLALMGYVVVAVTLGAGFEQDLVAAAEREGVAVNAVATFTQAQITHDHALYALITGLFLLLSPAFLLRAAGKVRTPQRHPAFSSTPLRRPGRSITFAGAFRATLPPGHAAQRPWSTTASLSTVANQCRSTNRSLSGP